MKGREGRQLIEARSEHIIYKGLHDSKTICGESNLARTRPPVLDLKKNGICFNLHESTKAVLS